jgi:AcrR family transcriptional regulator
VYEEPRPRRRQARGERRAAQLLEAAAEVFTKVGYAAATTNAIAREAGVSPGTLYQFFPNKEAIAIQLGSLLNHRMVEMHGAVFTPENAVLPLRQMLDATLDPLLEFNCENPVFLTLVQDCGIPGQMAQEHHALHGTLLQRVEDLLALRAPRLAAEDRTRIAAMTFGIFKAGLTLVLAHRGEMREAYITELKSAVYGYLAPYVGTDALSVSV